MNLSVLKSELRNALGEANKLPFVFEKLDSVLSQKSKLSRFVTLRKAGYADLKNSLIAGLITDNDFNVEITKIRNAVLMILDDFIEDDLKNEDIDLLTQEIKQLHFSEPLGSIHLVNCNREANYKSFENFFRLKRTVPHQYYFIVGCPTQQPAEFAERIVYEIINEVLDENDEAINYPREERLINGHNTLIERLKVETLPRSKIDLEFSKSKFRKHFAARIPQFDPNLSIEEFITQKSAQLGYAFFSFVFSIEADDWNESLAEYLNWLMVTFERNNKPKPTFQFYFIINMERAHESANVNVMKDIQKIVDKHSDDTALIVDLNPIISEDLSKWLRKATLNRQIPIVNNIVNTFINKLKTENRLNGSDKLNMMDVEELQTSIYAASLKR